MKSKIQPDTQNSFSKASPITSSNDILLRDSDVATQSNEQLTISTSKHTIQVWSAILWISLAIFLSICLIIVIVVPIAALANSASSNTSTICPTTSITTTVTSSTLPAQCSNYTTVTDATRSPTYSGSSSCDTAVFTVVPFWTRFTGSGGSLMASCPIDQNLCGAQGSGWYSGLYPSLAGEVTSGFVCFHFYDELCYYDSLILITNCNGFYIYYLREPPDCDLRYCTI